MTMRHGNRRDVAQEQDDFAEQFGARPIHNLNLHDEDEAWYGTRDHQRWEADYEQAAEGAGWDYFEPPAGTMIPGVGEV